MQIKIERINIRRELNGLAVDIAFRSGGNDFQQFETVLLERANPTISVETITDILISVQGKLVDAGKLS